MIDLSENQRQHLAVLEDRLRRVEQNEVLFDGKHLGPDTPDEKAAKIKSIQADIARVKAGHF